VKRPSLAFPARRALFFSLLWLGPLACGQNQPQALQHTFDACAPLTVVTTSDLTDEQAQGVRDGIAMWNAGAATHLSTTTGAASDGELIAANTTPDAGADTAADAGAAGDAPDAGGGARVPLLFQRAAGAFHGLYDDADAIVFINEDLTDPHPLTVTVAHELGHVFGLLHVPVDQRVSLMNSGNTTTELTPQDVDALAVLWGRCPG
jgi:hypothetical protein